jgi:hypothetical protein
MGKIRTVSFLLAYAAIIAVFSYGQDAFQITKPVKTEWKEGYSYTMLMVQKLAYKLQGNEVNEEKRYWLAMNIGKKTADGSFETDLVLNRISYLYEVGSVTYVDFDTLLGKTGNIPPQFSYLLAVYAMVDLPFHAVLTGGQQFSGDLLDRPYQEKCTQMFDGGVKNPDKQVESARRRFALSVFNECLNGLNQEAGLDVDLLKETEWAGDITRTIYNIPVPMVLHYTYLETVLDSFRIKVEIEGKEKSFHGRLNNNPVTFSEVKGTGSLIFDFKKMIFKNATLNISCTGVFSGNGGDQTVQMHITYITALERKESQK